MVVQRNFKYRIYPSAKQEIKLNKTLSDCCFVYNKLLESKINAYKTDKTNISQFDMNKIAKDIDVAVHSQIKQNISKRINDAFNHFFRRIKEKQNGKKQDVGFPRFKKLKRYKSITFPQSGFKINRKKIYLSKIGNIPIILHREINGKIKTLIIKKNADKWFAIFSCEIEVKKIKHTSEENVGIDVGIEDFATLSNGEKIENPRFLIKSEKKIVKLQRRLSRKKKGSSNRRKVGLKVARQYEKIVNQRDDFLHNQTANIVRRFKIIAVEELNINGMVRNRYLAKSIQDASWGRFVQMLSYKAEEAGGKVELVNPRYTSQICSSCGNKQKMPLNKRIYKCENCGIEINRDVNASKNILMVSQDLRKPNASGDIVGPLKTKADVVEGRTIFEEDAQP